LCRLEFNRHNFVPIGFYDHRCGEYIKQPSLQNLLKSTSLEVMVALAT